MASIELYHWEPCANSGELLILLHEKGIPFRSHYVDLLQFEQLSPAFLALNPRGQVPVLRHAGHVLTETTLILEYLEAVFPHPVLAPARLADRYRMQVWLKWADEYVAPPLCLCGWQQRMLSQMQQRDLTAIAARVASLPPDRQVLLTAALSASFPEDQITRAQASLQVAVCRLEDALAESPWLAGEAYSLADIALFPMAMALPGLLPAAVNERTAPHLLRWLATVRERKAVRAALGSARTSDPTRVFAPGPELARWG